MNETIAQIERRLRQASTELEKARSASELAWELRALDPIRAITISDETAATLRPLLANASALTQTDQFNAQTALATCLRAKAWSVYRLGDYDLAHRLAKDALAALKKTDDIEGEAHVYLILGNAAWRRGDYDEALDAFNACIERAKSIEHRAIEADALGNIGLIYHNLADYRAALDYHQRCLEIQREIGDRSGLARTFDNIGAVYRNIADYSNAMECYHRSLTLGQEIGDLRAEASALGNIGDIYFSLEDYASALESYQKSLTLFRRLGDRYGEATSLANIGNALEKLGNDREALAFQTDALSIFRDIGNYAGAINALAVIGSLCERSGAIDDAARRYAEAISLARRLGDRYAEAHATLLQGALALSRPSAAYDGLDAISLIQTALRLAETIEARELVYKAHYALFEAYKRRGELEFALNHHEAFHRVREAVFNAESDKRLRSLQIAHQLEQMRRDSELFQRQAEHLKQANDALSAALLEMEKHKRLAEEANQFKSHLLSIAAHDLRNPLSTIVSIAELAQSILTEVMSDRAFDKLAQIEEMLRLVHDSATRTFKLIGQILHSSRIESGKFQLSKTLVDLYPIAQSVVNDHLAQAQRKGQCLDFSGEPGVFVEADIDCVREIFENLISNAIKYSPNGKRISARLRMTQSPDSPNRSVLFSVRDEGQGLSAEDMTRLFGKFERLSARPTGGESSTGLGLSIVKQLVELHGGKVWAESKGKHQGATFFVELPASQPETSVK